LAWIRLVENEHFKAEYDKTSNNFLNRDTSYNRIVSTRYRLYYDKIAGMPNLWSLYRGQMEMFFGPYSHVKFNFMCQEIPILSREYFTYLPDENSAEVFNQRFNISVMYSFGRALRAALENYLVENGSPLIDENGNVVRAGATVGG